MFCLVFMCNFALSMSEKRARKFSRPAAAIQSTNRIGSANEKGTFSRRTTHGLQPRSTTGEKNSKFKTLNSKFKNSYSPQAIHLNSKFLTLKF